MPVHSHAVVASKGLGSTGNPANAVTTRTTTPDIYTSDVPAAAMNANLVGGSGGGSQPHNNMQPFLCVHFIISLFGIFPSQG